MTAAHRLRLTQSLSAALTIGGLALVFGSMAMAETHPVEVAIVKNGKAVRSGAYVTIWAGSQKVIAKRRQGRLFIPTDAFTQEDSVDLQIRLKGELVRIPVESKSFLAMRWIITLADAEYSRDYQWAVPKGADVRRSCFISYEFAEGDGPFTFHPMCRSKR